MTEYLPPQELHVLVLGPDAMKINRGNSHPDVVGGVYALFAEDGLLLYIGKSLHVVNRVTQHAWAHRRGERSKFTSWSAIDVPTDLMDLVEIAHIHALTPPENHLIEKFDHPQFEELVDLIRQKWGAE